MSTFQAIARFAATGAAACMLALAPARSGAVVTLTGCAGGSFGNACGLDELIAGGSFAVNGNLFSGFSLAQHDGRLLNAGAIRVDMVETAGGPGFTLVDTGNTLRAVDGDLTSNDLGFNVAVVSGGQALIGSRLLASVGDIAVQGSYVNVFADVFNPSLTNFLGNMTLYCDGPGCTNLGSSSAMSFSPLMSMRVVAGLDVGAQVGGFAQVNSVSVLLSPVPEPAVAGLLVAGLAALALRVRKSARRSRSR